MFATIEDMREKKQTSSTTAVTMYENALISRTGLACADGLHECARPRRAWHGEQRVGLRSAQSSIAGESLACYQDGGGDHGG